MKKYTAAAGKNAASINDPKATMRRIQEFLGTISAQDANCNLQFPRDNRINTGIGCLAKPLSETNPQLSDSPNPTELV